MAVMKSKFRIENFSRCDSNNVTLTNCTIKF